VVVLPIEGYHDDPKGGKAALDGASIATGNIIGMTMDDLRDKDQNELEREAQEEVGMLLEDAWWHGQERRHRSGISTGELPFHLGGTCLYDRCLDQ
jgi:hypothetical protein